MNQPINTGPQISYYAVLLIDVLGQKEALKDLRLPTTEEEKKIALDVHRKTYSVVNGLKEGFEKYFSAVSGAQDGILATERELSVYKRTALRIQRMALSDTIIFHVCLSEAGGAIPLSSLNHLLLAASFITMQAIAEGHPIRGGLEVGVAFDPGNGETYGPILAAVHNLESKIAEYPRIVIGPELEQYLKDNTYLPILPDLAVKGYLAKMCASFLANDSFDNSTVLDYVKVFANNRKFFDDIPFFSKALIFSEAESARFANDAKLGPRYVALVRYLKTRESLFLNRNEFHE